MTGPPNDGIEVARLHMFLWAFQESGFLFAKKEDVRGFARPALGAGRQGGKSGNISQEQHLICSKDIPTLIRELAGLETAKQIPRNEFIISENIQYDRSLPPEPRTLAVTFPERRILLDKNGNLFLFADKNDTTNLLSSDVARLHGDLPEDVKQNLRALGYLK